MSKPEIDEHLWLECQRVIPAQKPARLPADLGTIDGDIKVILVSGRHVKVSERQGKKNHKGDDDFMDFVEGGNGEEDPELCGPKEIVLDADHALDDLAPVCYHEAIERRMMVKYKKEGMTSAQAYKKAHAEVANPSEKVLRLRLLGGTR